MLSLKVLNQFWQRYTPITWLCLAFIFFSHIPRTAAMVNFLTGLMIAAIFYLALKRELCVPWKTPLVQSLFALATVILIGVVISPYWSESIPYVRRGILPVTLLVILLVSQKRELGNELPVGRAVLGAIVTVYVVRTTLATVNWWIQGFQHDSYSINRDAAPFVDFYAIDSTLLMPVVLAVCLYWPLNTRLRQFLSMVMLLGVVLVSISAVRTALLCIVLVALFQLIPFMLKNKKRSIILLATFVLILGAVFKPQIERLAPRYLGIFSHQTYQSDGAMQGRYGLWRATYEMVQQRPLLGYGVGWQKMTQVVHQEGFYERWENSPDEVMNNWANRHFRGGFGSANPHNLPLQILFETGVLGLLTYIWLLSVMICSAIKCWTNRKMDHFANAYAQMVGAYLIAYALVNITNGYWLNDGSTVALIVSGHLFTHSLKRNA